MSGSDRSESAGRGDVRELSTLVISAPFGNYVQPEGCTPTLGTFTRLRRKGRLWRIVKTVRYYPRLKAWVNRIGLRNPGMDWLAARTNAGRIDVRDKFVSIHGFNEDDWRSLVNDAAALGPLGIELNISCPNVGGVSWPAGLFGDAVSAACAAGSHVVVKLPPVRYEAMYEAAVASGVRVFHCCNTLPIPAGGLSGKPLLPVSLACIGDVLLRAARDGLSREITVIGGGGITSASDVDQYADAGVRAVAVGTKVMHPKYLVSDAGLREIRERSIECLGATITLPVAGVGSSAR